MDECGFESYEIKCEGCGTSLRGIIDPADDKLLRRYERARKTEMLKLGTATDGLQQLFARPQEAR